ncbi:hypothetical protein, partial [Rhodanobacter lindaniclasticus]
MTDPETPSTAPADADQLPEHTTPTWEVELLISGVAVFAMLQLPGWLDDRIFALLPRFDGDWAGMLTTLYVYLKSAAVILAITFMLHLTLRAYWIALVGMHSVFPSGVRWDGLRIGPIRRALEQQRTGPASGTIERSDNRATVVFALGVMLGSVLLIVSLVAGVLFAVIAALQWATGLRIHFTMVLTIVGSVCLLPYLLAHLLDRRFGASLDPAGWLHRAIATVFQSYVRVGVGRTPYVWLLVSSRVGELRTVLLMWLVLFPITACASLSLFMLNSPGWLGNYAAFPYFTDGSRTMNAAYYDDQRDSARARAVPYIQSAVVTDPYLRLVVPYQPGRDNGALQRDCAPALALAEANARAEGTLACLTRLHAVSLDGQPIA